VERRLRIGLAGLGGLAGHEYLTHARETALACSDNAEAVHAYGELLLEAEPAQALAALEHAAKLYAAGAPKLDANDSVPPRLYLHLATAHARAGLYELALGELRRADRALLATRDRRMVKRRLGDVLMALGRLDEAILAYEQFRTIDPRDSSEPEALALALDRDGQVARSRRALRFLSAASFIPVEDAFYHDALKALARGDAKGARAMLKSFLSFAAESPYRRRAEERLEQLERCETAGCSIY
jgi:tetratricopeptide (TPR) repeat protein